MPIYQFTIKDVNAANGQEAERIKESLLTVYNSLSAADLFELAKLLKENPGIVQKAKEFKHFL